METEIVAEGMDDLIATLNDLAQEFPDRFSDLLEEEAKEARKDVAKEARNALNTSNANRMSLGKMKNYKASEVYGYGANQQIDISAQSPHFHLIERGHELVSHTGEPIGWVPGYLIMKATADGHTISFPVNAERMATELLKEKGML